jgi:hypothetical protein
MRTDYSRIVMVVLGLLVVCPSLHAQSMMNQVEPEFRPQPKATTEPTELSPAVLDEILQTQATQPMPGGGEIPFTLDESADVAPVGVPPMNATANRFNYSVGSPAPVFDSPSFTQVQAGASGEDRPGAFRNTQYRWYGFVRLDGIYDFKPIGSTDSFVTATIPVPQGEGENTVLTPRYTRLGFDTSTNLNWSDWDVNTRIEMDFFNGNTSGSFGSFPIRLRFAWIEYGPLLIGQAASVFMDYDTFPNVLDYQGPNGMILMRQPIARLKLPLWSDNNTVSFGVEQPYSDIQWEEGGTFVRNPGTGIITDPTADKNEQEMPDFTGNIRHDGDFGHVQLSGIARQLTFRDEGVTEFDETGYGANLTGIWHPFAWLGGVSPTDPCAGPCAKSRIIGQYCEGRGINRYFQDPNGLGLDAVFTPATGFQAIDSQGWFVAYEQWWGSRWASVFSYSEMDIDLPAVLPADTYQSGQYASANLIFLPFDRMGMGLEFLYGERQNQDGQTGEAYRIQTAMQYKF